MPVVSKNSSSGAALKSCDGCCSTTGPHGMSKKIFWALMCTFLVFAIVSTDSLNQFLNKKASQVGKGELPAPTITVNGIGKVVGKNDIAMTTIGFSNIDKSVAVAQENNDKVMSQVMKDLKALGIFEKDLKTDYYVSVEYDYPADKSPVVRGYKVYQSVAIKIRDLNKIQPVLSLAGKYGANEVGGLSFTIDDAENLRTEARLKALNDAKIKADVLAKNLGMRLVEVVSYNEFSSGGGDDYMMLKNAMPMAAGGEGVRSAAPVSSGSTDVEMNVSVTYAVVAR